MKILLDFHICISVPLMICIVGQYLLRYNNSDFRKIITPCLPKVFYIKISSGFFTTLFNACFNHRLIKYCVKVMSSTLSKVFVNHFSNIGASEEAANCNFHDYSYAAIYQHNSFSA